MNFLITDTFTASFHCLCGIDQKAVKASVFDRQMDRTGNGKLEDLRQAQIDEFGWAKLCSDTSRPFPRPASHRIGEKVINHFGYKVMKVFGV